MAVDDEVIRLNPFDFQMASVLIDDRGRREAISKKLNIVGNNASSIDSYFVLTFWFSPENLGGTLETKVAYFSEYCDAEEYYISQVEKRKKSEKDMPYHVIWSYDSKYSTEFVSRIGNELSDFNIKCLGI